VALLCDVLRVSRSGYYRWASPVRASVRARFRDKVRAAVRVCFSHSRGTYGYRRIRAALAREGLFTNRKTVAAAMKAEGLLGRQRRRFVPKTTDSDHDGPVAPNLLKGVRAKAPDEVWRTDITYIRTQEGWMYLAGVIDEYTRRVVGWACAATMDTDLPLRALSNAVATRRPRPGLIHHSDRGSQYASEAYRRALARHGLVASMSRRGNCYDNAAAESFWSTLKHECIHRRTFLTRSQVRPVLFDYIECWYNTRRLHSSLGYQSPLDFEQSLN
jgi:transposase InsO family protein